ncbi:hypothetical protein [Paenibacillus sp. MBLB4367]|uniref:hypothetical protein n=1 Tax=Paenibacillus sp. MBLB4367 TaxID=3384767 RepID=UPI00390810E0
MTTYRYMLRFVLQPGHLEEERLEELIAFCRSAGIDDVMFFIDPMNLRHMTQAEVEPWLETITRAKHKLAPYGVTASVNPLNSLIHDSAANSLLEGQHFRLMTDPNGKRSSVAVCPLCPEWRRYIKDMYAFYATVRPYSLWVEDDFRFHNHEPLAWGGCFCETHLREFARQAGVPSLEREDFVQGMLKRGDPHGYRKIWLDSCRRTMPELAKEIAEAVHRVSPETRIGLMTSSPIVHAAEGRDWHGLFGAFDGKRPGSAIVRPHLPAYREASGMQYAWDLHAAALTAAFLPAETEAFPELENVPYTLFSKSAGFQKYQLETSLLLGSRGITLNIIDMAGNGIYPEERAEEWLGEEKPFLQAVAALQLRVQALSGVQVLVNEQSSYHLHTSKGSSMEEMYPRETFWSSLLSAFGVANRYTSKASGKGSVVALSGQVLRNYGEEEIRKLFAEHAVLLEGEAVRTLCEMGLGSLCGALQAEWRNVQAYEQIQGDRQYAGIQAGRLRPYLSMGRCLDVSYEQGAAAVVSNIHSVSGEVLCTGMTVVNGSVFVLPYSGYHAQAALLNPIRRAVIQEFLLQLAESAPLMIRSYCPHVSVYEFRSEDKHTIAIANHSLDEVESMEFAGADVSGDSWKQYSRTEPEGRNTVLRSTGSGTLVNCRVAPLSLMVLHRTVQ